MDAGSARCRCPATSNSCSSAPPVRSHSFCRTASCTAAILSSTSSSRGRRRPCSAGSSGPRDGWRQPCSACWRCERPRGWSTCTRPVKPRWCSVCHCGLRTGRMPPALLLAALHRGLRRTAAGARMSIGVPLLLFAAMLALMALRVPVWVAMFVPGAIGLCSAVRRGCAARLPQGHRLRAILDLRPVGDPALPADGPAGHAGWTFARAVSRGDGFRRPLARRTGAGGGDGQRCIRCGLRLLGRDRGDDCTGGPAGNAALPLRRRFRRGDARGRRHARHPDTAVGRAGALRDHRRAEHRPVVRRRAAARSAGGGAVLRRDRAADAAPA